MLAAVVPSFLILGTPYTIVSLQFPADTKLPIIRPARTLSNIIAFNKVLIFWTKVRPFRDS
jgi:cytochrome c oxidase assembly factor CtaG